MKKRILQKPAKSPIFGIPRRTNLGQKNRKISNLLEDLEKLDRFAQSVDDELNRIVSAGEGCRKDP